MPLKPLGITHYVAVLSEHSKEASLSRRIGWRLTEWGEMFINTPSNKLIESPAGEYGRLAYEAFGLIIFCWFVYILYFRKNNIPFFIKAYIFLYCMIMFNWPFSDPRFWVPIMPIIGAVILQTLFSGENKILKYSSRVLAIVYIGFGALACGYMIHTSLDKKALAKTQARGVYRSEYEIHFFGKPLSDTVTTKPDTAVISILKRYD